MVSSLIAGSIAIILLLLAGYVIASGILTIGETTVTAQTEMTEIQQKMRLTDCTISNVVATTSVITVRILNTGSTSFKINDQWMDLFVFDGTTTSRYSPTTSVPTNNYINQQFWDPGETLYVVKSGLSNKPVWVNFVTPNGVSVSTPIS